METRKIPLQPGTCYHIYNRGINGQNIFLEERNYAFFLNKYSQYVHPFVETFAYSLLGNHFHFLIRTKEEGEIRKILNGKKEDKSLSWHLSNAFGSLFKSYAQAINKHFGRTGGFFEEPFHRIEVNDDAYFSWLVWYIHFNPQKHGFTDDYRNYPYSSYQSYLLEKNTRLNKREVFNWFGDQNGFIKFHEAQHRIGGKVEKFVIEFD